jgi:hypothetical protein
MSEPPTIPDGINSNEAISFARAIEWVGALEQILARNGIKVPTTQAQSDFDRVWLTVMYLEEARAGKYKIDPMADIRPDHRKAIGLIHLAELIFRAQTRGQIQTFIKHIELLPKCRFAQNDKAFSDDGSNKVFELLIGLACSEIGHDVSMDDPAKPKGNNPDVLVTIDDRRWGFACKVLNGYNPQSMFDRLKEGIDQIERSEAEIGCVVFNLKNVVDHEWFWPITNAASYAAGTEGPCYGCFRERWPVEQKLKEIVSKKHFNLVNECSPSQLGKLFIAKKTISGSLLFIQTVVVAMLGGKPVISNYGLLSLMKFGNVLARDAVALDRLNDVMHRKWAE